MKRTTFAIGMWLAAALVGGTAVAQAHVTGVTIAPATLSGPIACPVQQIFVGQITSTVAGKVGFQWTTSDGQHSPLQQAIFDSPSVKPVSYLWMALSKKPHIDGWVRLETKTPNRKTALVRVSVSCRH